MADTRHESVVYGKGSVAVYQEGRREGDDVEGTGERKTLIEILKEQQKQEQQENGGVDVSKGGKPGGEGSEVESAMAPFIGMVFDGKRRKSEDFNRQRRGRARQQQQQQQQQQEEENSDNSEQEEEGQQTL